MSSSEREALVDRVLLGGRLVSTAAVLFHTAVAARLGLSATESKALDVVQRAGALTAGELAARSGLAPASVTALLDRLERKGVARRRPHPDDGRRVLVEVVPEGLAAYGSAFDDLAAAVRDVCRDFDDEQLAAVAAFLEAAASRQTELTRALAGRSDPRRVEADGDRAPLIGEEERGRPR